MAKPPPRKLKKKVCQFCKDKVTYVDYKDTGTLRKYISDRGKIRASRHADGQAGQLPGDCLRLLVRAHVAGSARPTKRLDLLLGTAGGQHGQPAGQEVVAGVPALHLDGVTGGTETGDLSGQDQLGEAHGQRAVEV